MYALAHVRRKRLGGHIDSSLDDLAGEFIITSKEILVN